MSLGNAAVFLLIAVLAGAVLWRRRFPFWARVVLIPWAYWAWPSPC
jgi:hypothetical protein